MRYQEGSAATAYREQGFLDTIRKYPGVEILSDNQYTGATTESAYRASENILNRFPEFDAIWMPNESSTFGCLRALQDRGIAGNGSIRGIRHIAETSRCHESRRDSGAVPSESVSDGLPQRQNRICISKGRTGLTRMIDTGGYPWATPENMNEPEVKALLLHDFSMYMQ